MSALLRIGEQTQMMKAKRILKHIITNSFRQIAKQG